MNFHSTLTKNSLLNAEDEDASELNFGEEFKNAKCLLVSEVQLFLEHRKEMFEKSLETSDGGSESELALSHVFNQMLNYTQLIGKYKNKDTLDELRNLLSRKNFHEYEVAVLGNLCPETSEEAKALIPSLEVRFEDDELQTVLDDMKNLRNFQ
eukprot:Sdes_comp18487_c0_seq2m8485